TRDIAARPREAGDEPAPDWICVGRHYDGDCLGRVLGNTSYGSTICNDNVYLQMDKLSRELGGPIFLPFRKSPLNDDILSLNIAEVSQPVQKCVSESCTGRT